MLIVFIYAYWCPTQFPYQMMFVSFNNTTTGVTCGACTANPFRRLWKGCLDSPTCWRPHTEHIYIYICMLTLWSYNMKQGNHFNKMKIFIIEHNCLWSDFQRENRERFCIKELRVLHPDELTEHKNHDNEQFHFISAKYKQNIDNIIYIQWRRIWNSNKYKKHTCNRAIVANAISVSDDVRVV
jgi:hypothetical protein